MENSNRWIPGLLTSVNAAAAASILLLTYRWLPADVQQVMGEVPGALTASLNPFSAEAKQVAGEYLSAALTYMVARPTVWIWGTGTLACAGLSTWFVQLLLTGMQPTWRYIVGFAVAALTFGAFAGLFSQLGLVTAGLLGGYPLGQFFGWWAAVGYRRTSQRVTDARTVRTLLSFAKPFKPQRHFDLKRGVFMGLGPDGRPVYIPLSDAHKHLQLLGETRNGKTVAATVLLAQCALLKETVLVLDPKADKHAPRVLKAAAERAGVPFVYIDLRPDQSPQFSPLSGASPSEVEELLISCFDLASKGTDADVYRVEDRAAARKLARTGATSFAEMVAIGINDESITEARKFWEDLQELAAHPVIQTNEGWRLDEWIGRPAVVYIAGSTRHDNTVRLQKLVLLRLLQLIDRYGAADDANWSALFIDEFKYLLSPGALRALGTIGDRNCHLLIAHQSLGDLRDAAGLDPDAVYGAVVVNTGLKLFYKTNDPDTATWGAQLSGQIPTFTESISKSPASASPGAYQERTRPLIDENMLLALPPLTGMLYGSGVARLMCVHYLPKAEEPPAVTPAPLVEDKALAMGGPI
jgi:hypothetical protein